MSDARPVLVVVKDGAPMEAEEARALWVAFSAHMDEHRGDMAGFAKARGYHSVAPEYRKGQAVLLVWTTAEAAASYKPAAPPKPAAKAPPKHAPPKKPQGGSKPAPKGGSKPTPKGGPKPAPKGGSKPAPKGGSKPAPKGKK